MKLSLGLSLARHREFGTYARAALQESNETMSAVLAEVFSMSATPTEADETASAAGLVEPIGTNLAAWLRADLSITFGTGAAVATWGNNADNTKNATEATGSKQPVQVTNVLNGKSVLRSTRAALTRMVTSWTLTSATTLIFVVGNADATADCVFLDDAAGDVRLWYNRSGQAKKYEFCSNSVFRTIGTTINNADWHILCIKQDDAGNLTLFFDGVQTYNAARDEALVNHILATLFCYHLNSNEPNFDMAEVLWYKEALNTTKLNNLHSYLSSEYGISVTLN